MGESRQNWLAVLRDSLTGAPADRRSEQRRYVRVPIEVTLDSGESHPGFSRDLTRSGMGAVVSTELKIGEEVWLTFTYPIAKEPHEVSLQATVRQRLGFRYGFEFRAPLDL